MKIQDILFWIAVVVLIYIKKPRITAGLGIAGILLSIPLFYLKIALFTAQRLIQYAAFFFFLSIFFYLRKEKLEKE